MKIWTTQKKVEHARDIEYKFNTLRSYIKKKTTLEKRL